MAINSATSVQYVYFEELYQAACDELVTSGDHKVENATPRHQEQVARDKASQMPSTTCKSKRGRPSVSSAVCATFSRFIMEQIPKYDGEASWARLKDKAEEHGIIPVPRNSLKRNTLHMRDCKKAPQSLRDHSNKFIYYFTKGKNNSELVPNESCDYCNGRVVAENGEDVPEKSDVAEIFERSAMMADVVQDEKGEGQNLQGRIVVLEGKGSDDSVRPSNVPDLVVDEFDSELVRDKAEETLTLLSSVSSDEKHDYPDISSFELPGDQTPEVFATIDRAFSRSVFKSGEFDRSFIGKNVSGVSIGSTSLNRRYLNEGSPSLAFPLKIHVTLDREVLALRGNHSIISILLSAQDTFLAEISVDLNTKTFTKRASDTFSDVGRLFLDDVFYSSSEQNAKRLSKKVTEFVSDEIICCQFNWPFRQKKELKEWKAEISSRYDKTSIQNIMEIDRKGLQIAITGGEEHSYLDSRIIPFAKTSPLVQPKEMGNDLKFPNAFS